MPNPPDPKKKDKDKLLDESMQRALTKVQGEMPDVKKVNISSTTSNPLTSLFAPRTAYAVTNPFSGNISYNPKTVTDLSRDETENMMAHELTHVRQSQGQPWYKTAGEVIQDMVSPSQAPKGMTGIGSEAYYWKPREMEAFQAERDRAVAQKQSWARDPITGQGDIELRKPKPITNPIAPSSAMLAKKLGSSK